MKRTILRSAAVLGTVGFAGFLLAACSNNSSGSSEASKEINVYVDKGYKSYVEEAAKAFEKAHANRASLFSAGAKPAYYPISDNKLPSVMSKSFVRLRHLVGILTLFECAALLVDRVHDFSSQSFLHRSF